jgi:hypothetical protein
MADDGRANADSIGLSMISVQAFKLKPLNLQALNLISSSPELSDNSIPQHPDRITVESTKLDENGLNWLNFTICSVLCPRSGTRLTKREWRSLGSASTLPRGAQSAETLFRMASHGFAGAGQPYPDRSSAARWPC